MPTISVALCSFNGSKFLTDQLNSFLSQTRQPDEIIICDDGSSDNTPEILHDFLSKSPFLVKIYKNAIKLGPTKNFEKAIHLCSGDIIFLSDQDDVWHHDKIRLMASYLDQIENVGGVFCDAVVTDQLLQSKGFTVWDTLGFNISNQRKLQKGKSFELLLRRNVVTGAAFAFRANFKNLILPIPDTWGHDGWIALIIAAKSGLGIIDEPLVYYRQHGGNQVGAAKKTVWERIRESTELNRDSYYVADIRAYEAVYHRLLTHLEGQKLNLLKEKLHHLYCRSRLPKSRLLRIPTVLKELLAKRYHHYSRHWQVALRDIIIP